MITPEPAYSETVLRRVDTIAALLEAGRFAEGFDLTRRSLAEGMVHARLYGFAGFELEDEGRYEEALEWLERGLKIEPDNAELICTTGFCLLNLERRPEALAAFRAVVALDPDWEAARCGLASALRLNAFHEEARAEFEAVVRANPHHAQALADLAGLAQMRGDDEAARSYAERSLALSTDNAGAELVLAQLEIRANEYANAETRLRRAMLTPKLPPNISASLKYAIGDALDGQNRTHEAFEAYVAANDEAAARYVQLAPPGREGAADSAERNVKAFLDLEATISPATPASVPGTTEAQHAFLVGFPRSGTTLLENVLASHPGVVTLEERPTLVDSESAFMRPQDGLKRLRELPDAELEAWREAYWRRVSGYGLDPQGKLFIDKHPLGTLMLPVIARLFPEARILVAIRDPRDVVLSCFRRNFVMNLAMLEFTDLARAARFYDVTMRARAAYLDKLPLSAHEVRYERMVADFDAETTALCDFLGIEWTAQMRRFSETARAKGVKSRSANQVVQGLYQTGVEQWRRYDWALSAVTEYVQPWVEQLGYPA